MRTPSPRPPTRGLAACGLVIGVLAFGCAGLPGLGPAEATPTPTPRAKLAPPAAFDSQAWSSLSRSGHAAMRPHRYSEAERSFRRALMTTEPLPPHDARIRASLGNLVRVAAAYHRAGRTDEAEHLMVLVRNHVQQQRTTSRMAVRYDELDRSFIELTRVRARMIRKPTLRGSSASPVHHGFDPLIRENARRFGLDPALVKAVVAAESNFEVAAVSHAGAQGLMQLMPATAREMGVKAPFDPRENLMGGSRYLRDMLDRYDDVKLALAAYNAGPTAVDRHDGVPPYPETTAYVDRVLRYFEDYRQQSP